MPDRRMGPQDSATSNALLDATERVLRNHGYGAATSRRVAAEAGLKQQLVYYYFRTMDELLLATFVRRTRQALAELEQAMTSDRPIRAIWGDLGRSIDARLAFEFMAMANHHDGIRDEVRVFMARARTIQADLMGRQLAMHDIDAGPLTPGAIVFIAYSAMLLLGREEAIDISVCHDEVRALAEWALQRFD
jgi:TetR/AcrR family transcriptional regulator of autoinduction and epiphytic fitness